MLKIETLSLLKEILPDSSILKDEPMSKHVSFKTGGRADFFVTPANTDELTVLLKSLRQSGKKFIVIGNGSNLLVSDSGYDGVIVSVGRAMSDISVDGTRIIAMAGALLSRIASVALKNSLTGFEFASGIPGCLGGAVMMNAGAYGGEIKDVVIETKYISKDGTVKTAYGEEHGFGYRKSIFTKDDVIISSVISLEQGSYDDIKRLTDELSSRRREKQPLEYPSAGSTFKRPEGYFAAKLIDDSGLRGERVGGAMVSQKHCGFVINYDNASSTDIFNLMKKIKITVYEKFGVTLEPEVRFVGEFPEF